MAHVLVTGSSTGIGRATAVSLARAGHRVYATMRNPDAGGATLELAAEHASNITLHELDVNSDESVEACFGAILADHAIDALVNNAGVGGGGAVEETSLQSFRDVMETNYFGVLRCTKAVLPHMRLRGSGVIVNVSSVAGRVASAGSASYAASKWALEGLSESLGQELAGTGVRVAVVEPGVIATEIFGKGGPPPQATAYPHRARTLALFRASLETPVSPFVVGDLIRDVIETDAPRFRYLAGPDAEAFVEMRASASDEAWIQAGDVDDESWAARIEARFGIDPRPYLNGDG